MYDVAKFAGFFSGVFSFIVISFNENFKASLNYPSD